MEVGPFFFHQYFFLLSILFFTHKLMAKTALYRLLKMGRRVTLGIGDNREHCFYIPVSFQMMRQYIDCGFEMEELVRNM